MASNKSVISKGHAKALAMIRTHLCSVGEKFARLALTSAIEDWDERGSDNLTGNTRTGFCAAVYYDGRIIGKPITVFDIEGISVKAPTHGFTYPGDSGFRDYSSGEQIGGDGGPAYVKNYSKEGLSFIETQSKGYGYEETAGWLRSHRPHGNGLVVVVANAVPYAGYLREARKLDVLDTSSNSSIVATNVMSAFREARFEDYEPISKVYG